METFKLEDLTAFAATAAEVENVPVPEINRYVLVRAVMAAERDAFDARRMKGKGANRETNLMNYRASLCALCMSDMQGVALFKDPESAANDLGRWPSKAIQRIFEACLRLNGISDKDVEDAVKNSDGGQSSDSGSDSPPTSEAPSEN